MDTMRPGQLCMSDSSSAGESNRLEGTAPSAGLTIGIGVSSAGERLLWLQQYTVYLCTVEQIEL